MSQCTAKSKQSKQRCKRPAIPGGTVCHFHGGAAPQVKLAAEKRLLLMQDEALLQLEKLLRTSEVDKVKLGAVLAILDRTGLSKKLGVEHSGGKEPITVIVRSVLDPKPE